MSIRYDCHMHSSFSPDSDAPMELMVRKAVQLGFSGICFTDHMDLDLHEPLLGDDPDVFAADPEMVLKEISRLRELYEIEIGFGLEFGMQQHLPSVFDQLARRYPLDFIPASCHVVDGRDPYFPQVWEGKTADEFIRRYYEVYYENICLMTQWDTLAHLDYVIRYIPERGSLVYDSMNKHADLIDALLKHVIDQGKCLEVNTAGYKYGLGQTNPSPAILKRYRELGGERITIGSDAHAPQHIGTGFHQTQEMLLALGFRSYTVFHRRVGTELPLEEYYSDNISS